MDFFVFLSVTLLDCISLQFYYALYRGKVVSREKLMERLWQTDSFVDENTLTVNVNRLRKKLENKGLTDFITTKFGVGYIVG